MVVQQSLLSRACSVAEVREVCWCGVHGVVCVCLLVFLMGAKA